MTYSFHFYCLYPIHFIYEAHLETTKALWNKKKMNKIKGNTIQSENNKINDENIANKVTIQNKAQDSQFGLKARE